MEVLCPFWVPEGDLWEARGGSGRGDLAFEPTPRFEDFVCSVQGIQGSEGFPSGLTLFSLVDSQDCHLIDRVLNAASGDGSRLSELSTLLSDWVNAL
jgi:hypothetical protein